MIKALRHDVTKMIAAKAQRASGDALLEKHTLSR
jgi:hypothetical protein